MTINQRTVRLLLVDDDTDFRNILAFALKKRGYQIATAANGQEAFDLIVSNPIDLVISDIKMPGDDGVTLVDRLRREQIGTPIILLVTGFSELSTADACQKGIVALFAKPLDKSALEETIQRVLGPKKNSEVTSPESNLVVELQFEALDHPVNALVAQLMQRGISAMLRKDELPNVNDVANLEMKLQGCPSTLNGTGVVKWVRLQTSTQGRPGCGIEFTGFSEVERKRVIDFLTRLESSSHLSVA